MLIVCKKKSSDQFGVDMALCMWNVSYTHCIQLQNAETVLPVIFGFS